MENCFTASCCSNKYYYAISRHFLVEQTSRQAYRKIEIGSDKMLYFQAPKFSMNKRPIDLKNKNLQSLGKGIFIAVYDIVFQCMNLSVNGYNIFKILHMELKACLFTQNTLV